MASETLKRYPPQVIIEVINNVEWEEIEEKEELRQQLTWLQNDSSYKAPEQYFTVYNKLSQILNKYLGNPDTAWKKKISNIIQNIE